jgi:hypothetical protein
MRDAVGNELKIGDLVCLQLDRPLIYGRVVKAEEGGLITGMHKGGAEVRPSVLVIASNHTVEGDPRALVGSVIALRDPAPPIQEDPQPEMPENLPN